MGYELKKSISFNELAKSSGVEIYSKKNILIERVSSFNQVSANSLSFSKEFKSLAFDCAILIEDLADDDSLNYIKSTNPRLDFIKLLEYLDKNIGFTHCDFESVIHPSAKIGNNVVIENGCVISENVVLEHNVVIHKGTILGKNTRIRANSSIGGDGFGFEKLEDGFPIRFTHLGGVIIGENVEIGSNTCICRGTLSNTIIKDNVKIDNLVHIAHNCVIEENAFVIACAEVSGGVRLGRNAWVGPNVSIIQKLNIGENSLIGIGSLVLKDVDPGYIYVGNPAKKLKKI